MHMDGSLREILGRFALFGDVTAIASLPGGHINRSWLATVEGAEGPRRYVLQRINERVFVRPDLVMENIGRITTHLLGRLKAENVEEIGRKATVLVPTRTGDASWVDATGGTWRIFTYIENSRAALRAEGPDQAYRAARAFGAFQRRLASYDGPRLHDTIPGFHDTPKRLEALRTAISLDRTGRASMVRAETEKSFRHGALANVLLDAFRRGGMPERIVHNDAKIANVLFDIDSGDALCVIDLDTVMPGLSLYDFGDMVRSMACFADEDATDLDTVVLQPDLVEAVRQGYLHEAAHFLTPVERALLPAAARLITYEQAIRFLTDYLDGDRYYVTSRPDQNLDRCRVQLALLDQLMRYDGW